MQPADLHSKKSKHETSQNKHQEKSQQGQRRSKQQSKHYGRIVKKQKRKCVHKKSLKSSKLYRQEPAKEQQM